MRRPAIFKIIRALSSLRVERNVLMPKTPANLPVVCGKSPPPLPSKEIFGSADAPEREF